MRRLAALPALLALGLAATGGASTTPPVVVLDAGHDLRANPATEPIGPGSPARKIKDGGGTRGVVTGLAEAELNLRVTLRLRARAGRVRPSRGRPAGSSARRSGEAWSSAPAARCS